MKKICILMIIFIVNLIICLGQNGEPLTYETTRCLVKISDKNIINKDVNINAFTNDMGLNSIFNQCGVLSVKQIFDYSKNESLLKIYEIKVDDDIDIFINAIKTSEYSNLITDFTKLKVNEEIIELGYNPVDWHWNCPDDNYAASWHLRKIQASEAWGITKGSADVVIAVIDLSIDINHTDLSSKIIFNYDPFTGEQYGRRQFRTHGTTVAGFAAAETDVPANSFTDRQALSLGFNTKFVFYESPSGTLNFLQRALHASSVLGVDVIVSCANGGIHSEPNNEEMEQEIVKEILNNGTVIIAPAGNGAEGTANSSVINGVEVFKAFYPFNPMYDDRIITVGGTNINDSVTHFRKGKNYGHSYFKEIDVCAPGHDLMGCSGTKGQNGEVLDWAYFYGSSGTSFSSPIVAGLAALIKAVDKKFTPAEVKYIIRNSTDPIADANLYVDEDGNSLVGTGRINAYKAVKMAKDWINGDLKTIISSNQTWSDNKTFLGNLVIPSGVILTITGTVGFSENSRIIVERGGKLIVNGGKLTSSHSGMWKGIEVWGSTDLAQSGTNYGLVTLNNATIENAETGVILAKRYSPTQGTLDPDTGISSGIKGTIGGAVKPITPPVIDANYSGGKIAATNSRFINNKSCVEFYLYTKKNSSYFHSCDFEMSNNIAGASNLVYINSTNGVTFEDCDFKFSAGGTSSSLKGIYASNSSFYVYPKCTHSNIMHVTPYCSNPTLENYSTFENLAYGIYAVGNSGTLPYSVKFTKFDGNSRGIYSSGIDNVSITDCDFKVIMPNNPDVILDPILITESINNYGVYCNGSTGYQIEDNELIAYNSTDNTTNWYKRGTYGIIINNSGGAANRIYRNNLNGFEVALQAQGNNRNASNGVGLCFTCNDFSYNRADISVVANSVDDANSVAKHQQNGNRPAANGFTWDSYQKHRWDFYNYTGGPLINYYQFNENANGRKYILTKYTEDNVTPWSSDGNAYAHEVECPRTPYNYRYNDVVGKQSLSEETKTKLDELVDGGNSSEMILAIGNATPLDAHSLGEMLSNNSPYLSNESVKATVANESAVDNVMLRDVLVGNSHAVRDEEIMRDVNERTNPLPAYMYEQIDRAAGTISGLDLLKIELQETLSDYTNAVTVVAQHSIVNDSIETWELLMSNALNEDLRYGYAVYSAIKGDLSTSSDVIDSMTDLNDVYIELLEVLSDTIESESSNEAAFSTLMSISEQDNRAGVLASTILSDLGYIDYQEPIYKIDDEDGFKHDVVKPVRRVAESMTSNINLYPNPAKDYIVVEYNVEGLSDKLTMTISDIEGKMGYSKKLSYSKDSVKIDVKSLTNGNYILNICSEGNVVYSKKFIVNNK